MENMIPTMIVTDKIIVRLSGTRSVIAWYSVKIPKIENIINARALRKPSGVLLFNK